MLEKEGVEKEEREKKENEDRINQQGRKQGFAGANEQRVRNDCETNREGEQKGLNAKRSKDSTMQNYGTEEPTTEGNRNNGKYSLPFPSPSTHFAFQRLLATK